MKFIRFSFISLLTILLLSISVFSINPVCCFSEESNGIVLDVDGSCDADHIVANLVTFQQGKLHGGCEDYETYQAACNGQ